MEYGGMGGGIVAGLGGGTTIALLPNTGGSLRVITGVAILSIIIGLAVIASSIARLIAVHKLGS